MEKAQRIPHPLMSRAAQGAWLLLCLLLPISGGLVPVPLGCAIVLAAINLAWHRQGVNWRVLWPIPTWYLLHAIGMGWSTDTDFGLFDLQVKLGLVLLPVAAAVVMALHPDMLHRSMVAFTAGIILSMVLGLAKAWACWTATGTPSCFSQSMLSYELHPSYAAWYACWALAWWGLRLIRGQVAKARGVVAFLLVLLLVWTMMLASKSGVIGLAMVIVLLLVVLLSRVKGPGRWWALGAATAAMLVAAWAQGPLVMLRMQAAVHAVERAAKGDPAAMSSTDGNDLRLVAWACSIDQLRHAPFGAGTGDIKHALMSCYHQRGAEQAAMRDLNSHSQFLQGAVALGWPGLVLTVLIALVPIAWAWGRRQLPMLAFMGLFVVNAAVESVLEVQAGVLFFALFIGLLAQWNGPSISRPSSP